MIFNSVVFTKIRNGEWGIYSYNCPKLPIRYREHPNFEDNQELNAFREQGKEVFGFKKVFLQIWDAPSVTSATKSVAK